MSLTLRVSVSHSLHPSGDMETAQKGLGGVKTLRPRGFLLGRSQVL